MGGCVLKISRNIEHFVNPRLPRTSMSEYSSTSNMKLTMEIGLMAEHVFGGRRRRSLAG